MDVNNDGFFENEPVQNQLMALIDENQRLRAELKFNTTPPQRTWQGLTDEQYLEACQIAEGGNYMVAFQRIQQWLKDSNT